VLMYRGGAQMQCGVHQITPWPFLILPWNPAAISLANWQVHDEWGHAPPCLPSIISLPSHPSLSHLLGSSVVFGGGSGVLVLGFGGVLGCSHVYNRLIRNRYIKNLLILVLRRLLLVSCNVNIAVCLVEWWVNISKSRA
jgi:hypothetical protein